MKKIMKIKKIIKHKNKLLELKLIKTKIYTKNYFIDSKRLIQIRISVEGEQPIMTAIFLRIC